MKAIALIITLISISTAGASEAREFQEFNQEVIENIDLVIKDNPEIYERINRGPASVGHPTSNSPAKTTEALNYFEEQGHGPQSW